MCGIAGILSTEHIDREKLKRMTDAIAHRGPDGEGQWLGNNGRIALGHRRLSIIDLSNGAAQPMVSNNSRFVITFNGEIYNYIELRNNLEKEGHQFRTQSDTEVLLKLFELKGEKSLELLEGMFAFAVWDEQEKKLFCARDRFGEKPFYYCIANQAIYFASEMKAFFAIGLKGDVDNEMLYNFLHSAEYITHPQDRSRTFYSNILKLPPATWMSISEDLKITRKKYWDLSGVKADPSISYDSAREQFRHLLKDSVKRRLRSDVPVGSSLSGGLDSSSIVSLIHELDKDKKIKQNSFSARFKNFKRDEGFFIETMTSSLDIASHYTWPDEEGFISDLEKLIYHQEEPFPSASIYAQYCVMKLAKAENVTVLLDGQGADELLAGYEYYLGFYLRSVFNEKPLDYPGQLEAFKSLHKHLHFKDLREKTTGKIQETGVKEKIKGIIRPVYQRINPSKYKRIAARLPLEGFFSKDFVMQFNEHIDYDFTYKGTDLNGYLRYSTTTNNLEDLLRFCDRNSMAHSREVRLPFLDHTLAEFVFSLPEEYKIHNGWTKYILRDSMKEILPREIAWRVDKVGYEPPQAQWMKNKKVAELTNDSFQAFRNKKILHRSAELSADKQWPVLVSAFLFR